MKKKITLVSMRAGLPMLFLFAPFIMSDVKAQDAFSIGPALHYNFGDKKPKVSFGLEAAIWWLDLDKTKLPLSVNLGFDYRPGSTIVYTQAQTGILIAGISAGPYLELRKDDKPLVGMQADIWANYFVGVNYRARFGGGYRDAIGGYFKVPMDPFWLPREEDDLWDWDWD